MIRCLFLLLATIDVIGYACGSQHFLFAPQIIREGAFETVVFNLHGVQGRVTTIASIISPLKGIYNFEYQNKDAAKPILMKIKYDKQDRAPDQVKLMGERQHVELVITVRKDSSTIYQTMLKMLVVEDSGYLHVQTDKPIYRPNEIVKFRVVALTNDDRPERERKVKVVFRIPLNNVGISEKSYRMSSNNKFIEDTFALPEYPVLGIWSVEARYEDQEIIKRSKREFVVRQYVLPTFDVGIVLDKSSILIKANMTGEYITGHITSQYTYGKHIFDTYYLAAKLVRPSGLATTFYELSSDDAQAKTERFRIATVKILDLFGGNVGFRKLKEEGATVYLEAAVMGKNDGTIESARSRSLVFVDSPYVIKIDKMSKYYMPGMLFSVKVDIVDSVTERPVRGVLLILTGPLDCGVRRCPNSQCCVNNQCVACTERRVSTDENGQINFNINMDEDVDDVIKTYKIQTVDPGVADENQASLEFKLHPYSSTNETVLRLSSRRIANVGDGAFTIYLQYKSAPSEFRYMIAARGTIVAAGSDKPEAGTIQHTMEIIITSKMVPSFRLFVYYLYGNEMVSNSLWVDVKDACKKEIKVKVPKRVLPGQQIEVEYEGSPNALIGVSAVGRASHFLHGDTKLTRHSFFKGLNQYDRGCVKEGGKDARDVFEAGGFQVVGGPYKAKEDVSNRCNIKRRMKREAPVTVQAQFEEDVESCGTDGKVEPYTDDDCFARFEIVLENRGHECAEKFFEACKNASHHRSRRTSSSNRHEETATLKAALSKVRSRYEENMIWATETLSSDGRLTFDMIASHSISTFEFDTISMHSDDGFCVAETQNMTIFKDVFMYLNVPYSLKRRQQAEIKVSVLNYANEAKQVRLMVRLDKDICSHFPEGRFTELAKVGIYPDSSASVNFVVLPVRIPENRKVVIEIKAFGTDSNVLDHVKRSIFVEPEGEIREIKGTRVFDLSVQQNEEFTINLTFPENFVPGSRQCRLYPFSNFMGPVIQFDRVTKEPQNDVSKIISISFGNGEATMEKMGPNVYAHKYLTSVGKMAEGSPEYASSIRRLERGYHHLLLHICDSTPKVWCRNSFTTPSIWLNAFTNKVLAQTKVFYTTMDMRPVCTSIGWLINTMQSSDGSFKYESTVLSNWAMIEGINGAVHTDLTLTAYVLVSLIESVMLCDEHTDAVERAIIKATEYLERHRYDTEMNQTNAIALVTYAMTLSDVYHPYCVAMRAKLLTKLQYSDDGRLAFMKGTPLEQIIGTRVHTSWYQRKPLALDIEVTAYALMALVFDAEVNTADQQRFELTRKIVLWLIEQRDENGGFTRTQDTVIGLQALTDYMIWIDKVKPNKDLVDIDLTISSPNGTEYFDPPLRLHLDESNENMTTPILVPPGAVGTGILNVKAQGKGEGTISYRCTYRTLMDEESCHFDLDVSLREDSISITAQKLTIKVFNPMGVPSRQSIAEVTLLSGYSVIESSVKRMSQEFFVDGIVQRYQIANQKVVLYLKEITDRPLHLAFLMTRNVNIKDPEPASVTIYDYVEPSIRCSKFYALPSNPPQLRTSCKKDDRFGGKDICKCAEGWCMKCRTRKEQLEKTLCGPRINEKCRLCQGGNQRNCFNMTNVACSSSYVYVVNVIKGVKDTSGVFVSFEAQIESVYARGLDHSARVNEVRNFSMRKDCYDTCGDEALRTSDAGDDHKLFKRQGRLFLIMGNDENSEVVHLANGRTLIKYNLKRGDFVERIYPNAKCKAASKQVNGVCKKKKKRSKKQRAKCEKQWAINQSCVNLRYLRRSLIRGCVE